MNDNASFDYERSDLSSWAVAWIAAGLAAFVVAVPLTMPLAFPQSMRHLTPSASPALSSEAPPLEIAPRAQLQLQRRGDDQFSETYGWADRNHRVVRLPIARATELLAQRGLPGWPSR